MCYLLNIRKYYTLEIFLDCNMILLLYPLSELYEDKFLVFSMLKSIIK